MCALAVGSLSSLRWVPPGTPLLPLPPTPGVASVYMILPRPVVVFPSYSRQKGDTEMHTKRDFLFSGEPELSDDLCEAFTSKQPGILPELQRGKVGKQEVIGKARYLRDW